ncbi:hypothetical protein [Thiolapillus sp.]|uniref:hypothetical protein n=1 Tax=Thiolapillus sp. TaxID=2017437 RepID=UPI003AF4FF2D
MDRKPEKLLAAHKEGRLIEVAYEMSHGGRENRLSVSDLLAELHNKGDIDLIDAFSGLQKNTPNGPDFFSSRHLFEKALPTLTASVVEVMVCIQHLATEAGNDLAANTVFEPFIDFLATDPTRPSQALDAIHEAPDKWASFVFPAILAGTRISLEEYFWHAVKLVDHASADIGRNAIYALGRIPYPEGSPYPKRVMEQVVHAVKKKSDDADMAVVIKTTSSLARINATLEEKSHEVISIALEKGSDLALYAATEEFGFHTNDLPGQLLNIFISHIPRIKSENKGAIDNIDFGISALFKKDTNLAIECLENILLSNRDTSSLKMFDSVIHEILSMGLSTLNHLLTRWFIKGDRVLCTAIREILESVHGNQMKLEIDPKALPNNDPITFILLAHKAIGYLFFKPVTASSIIVSLLRVAKDDAAMKDLEELLLDPILMNYPGSVPDFLECQVSKEPENVSAFIKSVMARFDKYMENIRGIGEIPELLPALKQREAYTRNFNRQMSASYKQAMKGSIVEMIATKSVILYGRSSINYVQQGTSGPSRMEIPMQAHSVEMEFPRRHNLDPFGLEYMLRLFRAERLVAR